MFKQKEKHAYTPNYELIEPKKTTLQILKQRKDD